MEAQFGTQAQYLVDFCHLRDYLSAAGDGIAGNDKPAWMEEKKDWPIGSGEIESGHRLCVPEPAQDRRGLVEDGKPKKDDRSTGLASERRLG